MSICGHAPRLQAKLLALSAFNWKSVERSHKDAMAVFQEAKERIDEGGR
jgi:hypothetical protein